VTEGHEVRPGEGEPDEQMVENLNVTDPDRQQAEEIRRVYIIKTSQASGSIALV